MSPPALLSITGSDGTGRGGVQLDGRIACRAGVALSSVVTTLTWFARSRRCWNFVPPRVVAGQIDSAAATVSPGACTVGMIPTAEAVRAVGMRLKRRVFAHVVLHPTIVDPEGERILCARGAGRLAALLPLVDAVVVNPANARALLAGVIPGFLNSPHDLSELALALVSRGAALALVIGEDPSPGLPATNAVGHGEPPLVDDPGALLYDEKIGCGANAGGGMMPAEDLRCALISGLLGCALSRGASLGEAWEQTRPHAAPLAPVIAVAAAGTSAAG